MYDCPAQPEWLRAVQQHHPKKTFNSFYLAHRAAGERCKLVLALQEGLVTDTGYHCVSDTKNAHGRTQKLAERYLAGQLDWKDLSFFTNCLSPPSPEDFNEPSKRVAISDLHCFTFEFDNPGLAFLETQCKWLRMRDRPTDSSMGQLFLECSEFRDFKGITVVWSGNKSFHIHVLFNPWLMLEACGGGDGDEFIANLRPGFVAHWERLKDIVVESLPGLNGLEPDDSLKYPEAFRRLPGGSRVLHANNMLGLPAGSVVPQLVMWERWRDKAGKANSPLFVEPAPFFAGAARRKYKTAALSPRTGSLACDEHEYCAEQLRALYPAGSYPEFVRLEFVGNEHEAKFRNSPRDTTPSSVVRGHNHLILMRGTDADGLVAQPLDRPLDEMIAQWCEDFRLICSLEDRETASPAILSQTERDFSEAATSVEKARELAPAYLLPMIQTSAYLWVRGPEGSGKTTAIMRSHASIVASLKERSKPTTAMYAFGDYRSAEEKCEEFNALHHGSTLRGVVIQSFSKLYDEALKAAGVRHKITHEEAARSGKALLEAVRTTQPAVVKEIVRRHRDVWAQLCPTGAEKLTSVFFTVHEVAHGWVDATTTRLMWAEKFWSDHNGNSTNRTHDLRRDTELGLLVHDEVAIDDILQKERAETIEWVEAMVAANPEAWKGSTSTKLIAFDAFLSEKGAPLKCPKIDYHTVYRVLTGPSWEDVVASGEGLYPAKVRQDGDESDDFYAARIGSRWKVRPHCWWRNNRGSVATHVVVLTTETLPTVVIQQVARCWNVLALEPNIPVSKVRALLSDRLNLRTVGETCKKHQERLVKELGAPVSLISDGARSLERAGVSEFRSHVSARGSNHYVGKKVLQTLRFECADVVEELLVLNSLTGRNDCVAIHHADKFNQSAGRNIGFRAVHGAEHYLLANRRLFRHLLTETSFLVHTRYGFTL